MGGVSIISDTLTSVSGTISDLKTIMLILVYYIYIIPILFDKFHRTFCLFEVYSYKIRILFSLEPHIFFHPFTINNIIASRAVGSYISHI